MSSGSSKVVGKTATLEHPWQGSVGAFCGIIRASGRKVGNYLSHWFKSDSYFYWRDSQAKGTNIQNLRISALLEIPIPLPPLEEQNRIAGILNKAEEIKKLREEADKKTEELIPAIFHEMVGSHINNGKELPDGWKWVKLGEVTDFLNGFAFKSSDVVEHSNTQLLRMGNISNSQLNLDTSAVFYPDSYSETFTRYLLEPNDLVISLTGTIGKKDYGFTVKIPELNHRLLLNQRIAKIYPTDKRILHPGYLHLYLLSDAFLNLLYPTSHGVRQANLSTQKMKQLRVPLPQIEEQNRIVNRFHQAGEIKKTNAESDKKIEELKSSLLQMAFRGEL
jgi:type I restriction enzyme S subunit